MHGANFEISILPSFSVKDFAITFADSFSIAHV